MKYYLDTEFHEYQRKPLFSKPFRTIELISIGIVAEDGREYYAISKDFDLKAAWNSWQPESEDVYMGPPKDYWLRDNVLNPIWVELHEKELGDKYKREQLNVVGGPDPCKDFFTYRSMKRLLKQYGKSNTQIAEEVKKFTLHNQVYFEDAVHTVSQFQPGGVGISVSDDMGRSLRYGDFKWVDPEFYAYYADYDWVVFCWLFGRMIDLPKGLPMYCRDLKQISDEVYEEKKKNYFEGSFSESNNSAIFLNKLSDHLNYPKQSNEHNALDDAKWNKRLHKFIDQL